VVIKKNNLDIFLIKFNRYSMYFYSNTSQNTD